MTQHELIRQIARKFKNIPQDTVRAILQATEEVVIDNIKKEEKIPLFKTMVIWGQHVEPTMRRNPYKNELFEMPEYVRPRVKFLPHFKKRMREEGVE